MSLPTSADRVRQVAVTLSEVFCVIGTLFGVGVLGTRVQESSGGALAADATLLAPAGPAFSIWSLIYLGLAAYTVWQWLPRNATGERFRRTGWLAAVSMVLNAGWLLVTQVGWIWVSVIVIIALLVSLGELVRRLTSRPASGTAERLIVDGTFGAYLGWVSVATCANITAALVASGVTPSRSISVLWSVVVLVVVAAVGVVLAWTFRGRVAVAAAMAWGLAWITVGRLTDQPRSAATALVAALVAVVIIAATIREKLRHRARLAR
ncbi:tryptophan-rich sensory protein [Microlunatus panaciterrae]|uniref:TspO and MBR related proteins n=1 Tax=Microlunatus panaciterrae TaxID=400768 RepID=A0ABS2RL14_9ACTN|nr:TspO/MBR family protein [Microlunatus panaciterrae]MBM7798856.1 hypothetical protein [Microlunatus panaciterrae]